MKLDSTKPKIIIDTDAGHDDALAMMMLIQSNQFDIQAITTVAGNSTIDKVTRNAQAIVDFLGARIPVYSGLPYPLKRELVTAVVHGQSGLDGFDTSKTKFKLTGDAPQRIVEIVRENPNEVGILTIGPLSNLARAFQIDPTLPMLIPQIVTMGGAIAVPGNKNRVAEFNFFVDPEAADVVIKAEVPKVLVPLDACNDVVMQVEDFKRVTNPRLQKLLLPMMRHFFDGLVLDEGTTGILVYDALAAYFLINPGACRIEPMDIVVETQGEHTFGMSVAERRTYKKTDPNVRVVMSLDSDQFKRDFFCLLSKKSTQG